MKKSFIVLFGILCLLFVSCNPSSNSKSDNEGNTDEEPTTVQLVISIYDYTNKADFDEKIPNGVTYSWSDSKGKSEENLIYSGESDTITIYPTYESNVDVDFEWTDSEGKRKSNELIIKSIMGTKYPAGISLELKSTSTD